MTDFVNNISLKLIIYFSHRAWNTQNLWSNLEILLKIGYDNLNAIISFSWRLIMLDSEVLDIYVSFAPFLAQVLGPDTEIVIHDVTDPEHSVIAIQNNASGRRIGGPLTDLARDLIRQSAYTDADYLTNYNGSSKGADFLSSSFYIKNEGKLIGLMCINKNMTAAKDAVNIFRAMMERYNLVMPQQSEYSENLDTSVDTIMRDRIAEIIAQTGVLPARMSTEEKIRTVHMLSDDGVLTMKGAVAEAAEMLGVSVPTFYRYMKKVIE